MCKYHSCAGVRVHITPTNNIPSLTCVPCGKQLLSPLGLEWLIDLGNCVHVPFIMMINLFIHL